ncbi:MAG: acetyl-CoA acetyltransferase [Burkholderiaceae bacterium]
MNKSAIPDDATPVLVACGQVTQREPDPLRARSPIDLTADAVRLAADDSGAGDALLQALDTVVVIRSFSDTSWRFTCPFGRYTNPPRSLAARIGAAHARRLVYTQAGGNMPQWSVNRLAERIAAGEVGAALIAGGEALATQKAAQRAKIMLDWAEDPGGEPISWGINRRGWSDLEDRHGMRGAIYAYPLFEQAIRGAKGRTPAAHQRAMGELLAGLAKVAAANPLADRRDGFDAATISSVREDNPYIGYPYTRLMNANAFIDQAAAVIMTSVGLARKLGIARDRWVFLHGCADAHDHWFITERRELHDSPAMRAVLAQALAMARQPVAAMGALDLYSCFSSAVQVACDALGLQVDDPRGLTVTGGLPYFGGPGNNYVTHAIAQMMQWLRAHPGRYGLVTANGNYLTKHSAGVYGTEPPDRRFEREDPALLQAGLDGIAHPAIVELADGPASVESWTVMNERGAPVSAIIIGRLADGSRFIANTPRNAGLLAAMQQQDMLGQPGRVRHDGQVNTFVPG